MAEKHCKPGEIGAEFGDDMNSNPDFKPLSQTMRGTWKANNVPRGTTSRNSPLLSLPDLPGFHVFLDMSKRTARVVDPLQYEENAGIKLAWRELLTGLEPVPEAKYEDLSDEAVSSWAYWIGRLVEERDATLLPGSAKVLKAEDLPGDPVISPTNARYNLPITLATMKLYLENRDLATQLKRALQGEDEPK